MNAAATFIGRHGLVRYHGRLGKTYPRTGPCELGVCRAAAASLAAFGEARQAEGAPLLAAAEAERERLRSRRDCLLAWRPRLAHTAERRARELASVERRLQQSARAVAEARKHVASGARIVAEAASYLAEGAAAVFVFDHCHAHGWVRGVVCMACNNRLTGTETAECLAYPTAELAAIAEHLGKCPDCPRPAWAEGLSA